MILLILNQSFLSLFQEREFYKERCSECLRALLVWAYKFELVDHDANERANQNRVLSGHSEKVPDHLKYIFPEPATHQKSQ